MRKQNLEKSLLGLLTTLFPTVIYVWKEEKPEKPVMATEIEKNYFTNKNQS
jgi:hypothetical protein